MPRIINAYDGNSALGDSLAKLGESIYGDQAKNEVYRQKAFGSKRENDNIPLLADAVASGDRDAIARYGVMANKTGQDSADFNRLAVSNHANGLDDPRMALATMGAGGAFTSTAPGQGRALANDRSIAGGHDATTLAAQRIQSDRAAATQMAIDNRTLTPISDGNGGFIYAQKSNAVGQGAPMTTDQVKAGVISQALQRRAAEMQQQNSPFTTGAPSWNAGGPTPQPRAAAPAPQGGGVSAGAFTGLTPQELGLIGQNEVSMIHPGTGQTGSSWDNGATLSDGTPATGYVQASKEAVLGAEKANRVRTAAATPLPPQPTEYPQYAQDAYTAGGPGATIQHEYNAMKGLVGLGEGGADTNRARENLTNTNNSVRSLYASAPGTRAAVYREKNADRALPEAGGFFGTTGINAEQQRNRAMSEITHLRQQYALVQADATDPNTPPEEAAKMLTWMHAAKDAITTMQQPQAAPTAGAPARAAAPAAPAAPITKTIGGQTFYQENGQWYHQ